MKKLGRLARQYKQSLKGVMWIGLTLILLPVIMVRNAVQGGNNDGLN